MNGEKNIDSDFEVLDNNDSVIKMTSLTLKKIINILKKIRALIDVDSEEATNRAKNKIDFLINNIEFWYNLSEK